jgi:hypothetical protein
VAAGPHCGGFGRRWRWRRWRWFFRTIRPPLFLTKKDLWPALGRTTVPESFHLLASGSKMRTSSNALNRTCFFFLAGVDDDAEVPDEEPVEEDAADDSAAGNGAAGGTVGRSGSRSSRPWKATAGAGRPSAMGALRSAKSPASNSSLVRHFSIKYLILLTPASARPLLCGLRTEDNSWTIFLESQNSLNCSLNCGPPSDPIDFGQPNSWNQEVRILQMLDVVAVPYDLDQRVRGKAIDHNQILRTFDLHQVDGHGLHRI